MKINVLGTKYKVHIIKEKQREKFTDLSDDADGYCNFYAKTIVVVDEASDMQGSEHYVNQVIRHELVHAYLFESGLHDYADNERIVDWIAMQIPKMSQLFDEIEVM